MLFITVLFDQPTRMKRFIIIIVDIFVQNISLTNIFVVTRQLILACV